MIELKQLKNQQKYQKLKKLQVKVKEVLHQQHLLKERLPQQVVAKIKQQVVAKKQQVAQNQVIVSQQ